jgi:tRNA (guanine37-N1)-methyltransferase
MRFDILTTFPEMFTWDDTPEGVADLVGRPALSLSIPARARRAGLATWHAHNIRVWANNRHDKTDDRPFGGGPGMVMTCQPLWDAVHAVEALDPCPATRILLTPQGVPLKQAMVHELAAKPRLLLIAGHYEGIDERVVERLAPLEISLGDYILSGGELGAMVLIDAIVRVLPGALGHEDSALQDSFSTGPGPIPGVAPADQGPALLDCPHYTRPREWMGMVVPEVLLSGDHRAISAWRLSQRLRRTQARRPDLLGPGGGLGR